MTAPTVLDCGHAPTPTMYPDGAHATIVRADGTTERLDMTGKPFLTGAAHGPRGTLCYPCADSAQAVEIETAASFLAYDSGPTPRTEPMRAGWLGAVTTWTGGVLGQVIRRSTYRNPLTGSTMTALTVRTAGGRILTGRYGSDWSQAVILRPTRKGSAS